MSKILGLFVIVTVAFALGTAHAVPRYSAPVAQAGDTCGEEISFSGGGRIQFAQGGDDVVRNPAGDAIGIVRPSGEAHGFGDVKQEVVPKVENPNGSEVANNVSEQPAQSSNPRQSNGGQQASFRQLEDGRWADNNGYVYDNKTGRPVGCLPYSKCEEEIKKQEEDVCNAHEPIGVNEANKIAYDNLHYFSPDEKVEWQVVLMKDGKLAGGRRGKNSTVGHSDEITAGNPDDIRAVVDMHSHPYTNEDSYKGWPSFMDVVAHIEKGMKLRNRLREIECPHEGIIYSYIVYFTEYSGTDKVVIGSNGDFEKRKVYNKAEKPMLVRFDENGVYRVIANGAETPIDMPNEWNDKSYVCTAAENIQRVKFDCDFRENHRPYNFNDSKDVADAKNRADAWFNKHYGTSESGQVHLCPGAASSSDVKKFLEEFHEKFLTMPNSQFKWQEIQAYLDLIVSMQSWTLPSETVLMNYHNHKSDSWKDLVEVPLADDDLVCCWAVEKIGVRGWCKCQPPGVTKRNHKTVFVDTETVRVFDGQWEQNGAVELLQFEVCEKCGRCYTLRSLGYDLDDTDFHVDPYEDAVEEQGFPTFKHRAAIRKMEDAILSIPHGEIVVPINKICSCKLQADKKPLLVAFYEGQKNDSASRRMICCICGGLYSPKVSVGNDR